MFRHVCFVYGLFMCSALVSADGFENEVYSYVSRLFALLWLPVST